MSDPRSAFLGAKLMLFAGDRLLVLRRDDVPWIKWPGYLDFPGGLRDPGETPEACVLRELREELGLSLEADVLEVALIRDAPDGWEWFFAAHVPARTVSDVVLGDEGQGWYAMPPDDFAAAEDAIPHFREILSEYRKKKPGRAHEGATPRQFTRSSGDN